MGILHENAPVDFHFLIYELLIIWILRQVGKGTGQAKFESYLPNGQCEIQIFFEPCTSDIWKPFQNGASPKACKIRNNL